MKICNLTTDKFEEFLKFNIEINPTRNDIVERFQFQILDNPLLKDKSCPHILFAYDDHHQIIGQHLHNPFEYYFKGRRLNGFFGYDFFVLEAYRNKGVGSALAKKAKADFYPHFGIGVSEISRKIHLALGNKVIGNLFIFIWIRNILSPFRYARKVILKNKDKPKVNRLIELEFPEVVTLDDHCYRRVASLKDWRYQFWNEDVMEFSRSLEFLNWRFLDKKDKYYFYLLDEAYSTTYFVIRKIYAKGLRLLAIVDYRIPFEDRCRFKSILHAAKHLAKMAGCDGVFTMSSHRFFDRILHWNFFFKVGRPINILTNADFNMPRENIDDRRSVLATMAESDLDFYFEF